MPEQRCSNCGSRTHFGPFCFHCLRDALEKLRLPSLFVPGIEISRGAVWRTAPVNRDHQNDLRFDAGDVGRHYWRQDRAIGRAATRKAARKEATRCET